VVKEAGAGTSNARFDYLVMGVRQGFEDHLFPGTISSTPGFGIHWMLA